MDSEEENPYTSSRYLIMAIKHIVNIEAQRHEMVLKCYKDSVRMRRSVRGGRINNR